MPNFEIKKLEDITGKQAFYQLSIDRVLVIDDFEAELEDKYDAEFGSMFYQMQRLSDLQILGKKDYRPRKDLHDEAFEIKTENLRFYGMFVKKTGKVIVLCGFKNEQDKDERKVKSLIQQCIDNHTIYVEDRKQISKK